MNSEPYPSPERNPQDADAERKRRLAEIGAHIDANPEPGSDSADDGERESNFPIGSFPQVIRDLAVGCAEVFQGSVELPAVSAVTILAGGIGKQIVSTGAVNGRETPCTLFSTIGAPSGYGKSVADFVAKPLLDADNELAEWFAKEGRPGYRADVSEAEVLRKHVLSELKGDTLTSAGRKEARRRLLEYERIIEESTALAQSPPGLYVGSATGAALAQALQRNGEATLSYVQEAGDAVRIAAGLYRGDQKGDYDLLLNGYSWSTHRENRVIRGVVSMHPCLSVLWLCQPMLLDELFSGDEALERGLLARFNPVRCSRDVMPYDDGIVREVSSALVEQWTRLVRAAVQLRSDKRHIRLVVTPDAREIFRKWHNEAVDLRNEKFREEENKLARCRENAIRIANNFVAAECLLDESGCDEFALTAEHAERGVTCARWFLQSALNLTHTQRAAARERRRDKIIEILQVRGGRERLRDLERIHNIAPSEARRFTEYYPAKLKVEKTRTGERGPLTEFLVLLAE